jgi:hypothetical protein
MNIQKLTSVSVIIAIFLSACVTMPTEEEIAALDYGTCPRNYEVKIKEQFKDGLLTRYSDELIIWPPQQYWYKAPPQEGGQLYAGYLVPTMAEQTLGASLTAGKQLYGFMFKNDQLVTTIIPMMMQNLDINEAVGPFPKDERDWKLGYRKLDANPILFEFVLPGETVQDWSELVSVQIISNVSLNLSVSKFVADVADQRRSTKPGCAIVSQKILASTPTELLYEQTLAKCAPFRDEYSVRKAIRGPRSLTDVSYTKISEMEDAEKRKWAEIVGRTTSINECQ